MLKDVTMRMSVCLAALLTLGVGLAVWAGSGEVHPTSESATPPDAMHGDAAYREGDAGVIVAAGRAISIAPAAGHAHPMAALSLLPPVVRDAPARTAEAYLFSLANPDLAQVIPCYCGCVGLGHLSSYDCYVTEARPNEAIVFEPHALVCGVCVDITQDAMRLLDDGRAPPDIRAYIDATYAIFGPPTQTHLPDHTS